MIASADYLDTPKLCIAVVFAAIAIPNFYTDVFSGPYPPTPTFYLVPFGIGIWYRQKKLVFYLAMLAIIVLTLIRLIGSGVLEAPIPPERLSVATACLRFVSMLGFIILFSLLRSSFEQSHAMYQELARVREEERYRIARALHDELGQTIAIVANNLKRLINRFDEEDQALLKNCVDGLNDAAFQIRETANGLVPTVLIDLGLAAGVRSMAKGIQNKTGTPIHVHDNIGTTRFKSEVEITCFRTIQESLTNAIRHAQASQFDIEISHDDGELICQIGDNGRGFNAEKVSFQNQNQNAKSFGLRNIIEQARLQGGTISIDTGENIGTEIILRLPTDAVSK